MHWREELQYSRQSRVQSGKIDRTRRAEKRQLDELFRGVIVFRRTACCREMNDNLQGEILKSDPNSFSHLNCKYFNLGANGFLYFKQAPNMYPVLLSYIQFVCGNFLSRV